MMHGQAGLSATHEMYLKVLYRLQADSEVGRVRDMAKGLGVTASTVSAVLKKLEQAGLVLHDRYGLVKLTSAGTAVASCVVRRFEVLKAFLVEVLGLNTESAEVDSCAMEHTVSPATVNRMETMVEFVRKGKLEVSPMHHLRRSVSMCSVCDSTDSCQAMGTSIGRPVRLERN